ncbi:PREDICTED: caspase-1-like [Elephantulus edwardii]|uniref:caspase-1-like n=1 Tax=Elephantulus edwardii TaxID=28737 RepID=UPI0003F0DBB4|nr:PREDICTED: caspase-1-like [Elephantulus edwardii]
MSKGTINTLLDELLEKKVLNQEEMETIRDENATVMDKARALIDSIIKKGPRACEICICHIREDPFLEEKLGFTSGKVINIQDSKSKQICFASLAVQDNPAKNSCSGSGGILKLCSPDTARLMQQKMASEIYPMKEKGNRTRLALIICNTDFKSLPKRTGAEADLSGMKMLLEGLGYHVIVKQDLTASDMTAELTTFAARPEHEKSDSTFLVFMSHGIRDGICGKNFSEENSDVLHVNSIFQMLNTRSCPKLKDKPKVIIIQACRGENQGVVWLQDSLKISVNSSSQDTEDYEDDAIKRSHVEKDFIAFYSSTPDNVSWRHPTLGSLFIKRLIEHMQEYAASCHLQAIFQKIQRSFEMPDGKAQMPTTERCTLTRYFYLFPGY